MAEYGGSGKEAGHGVSDSDIHVRGGDDHANGFTRTLITVDAPPLTPKRRRASAKSTPAGGRADAAKAGVLPEEQLQPSAHGDTATSSAPAAVTQPTPGGVAGELWRIATGEGSESARVSALRTLADIFGMLRAQPPELPEAMTVLLDALSRGLGTGPTGQGGPGDLAAPVPPTSPAPARSGHIKAGEPSRDETFENGDGAGE